MQSPRLNFVNCMSPAGIHRMAYREWGDPANGRVLLCVHGLSRNGNDFDEVAKAMSDEYRVVCPDIAGRGASDFLVNPASYVVPQYVSDITTLLARLQPQSLDWLGTSMGGLIALAFSAVVGTKHAAIAAAGNSALPKTTGLSLGKLILNDVGPAIELASIERIAGYVGLPLQFDSFEAAVNHMKTNAASFGPLSDEQWVAFTKAAMVQKGQVWTQHYDLAIAQAFASLKDEKMLKAGEAMLWRAFEALQCPILLIRGERSDLLSKTTAEQMQARNKHLQMIEIPETGHAPSLLPQPQVQAVRQFLLS